MNEQAKEIIDSYIAKKYTDCNLRFIVRSILTQIIGIIGLIELVLGILKLTPFEYSIVALAIYNLTSLALVSFYSSEINDIKKEHQSLVEKLERGQLRITILD